MERSIKEALIALAAEVGEMEAQLVAGDLYGGRIADLEAALADAQAYSQSLERVLAAAGLESPMAPPPPLKVFSKLEDVVWEQWPDTPDTWKRFPDHRMQYQMMGNRGKVPVERFLPYRNVIVEGYGELRRFDGKSSPDPVLILQHRVLDVTAKELVARVQADDDSFESDVSDWEFLAKNYQGGLRIALSSWKFWPQFAPYGEMLAEARPDLVIDPKSNRIRLTPAG